VLSGIARSDIEAAGARIDGAAVRTPLLESNLLNESFGRRVLVKAECLQRTGSFKFRGAFNCLSRLSHDQRGRGVVAFSSGNHAQGVAAAAALLGIEATIVMPADAPRAKLDRTRRYGANIVTYDRQREDRRALAESIAARSGATLVPPFDHPDIIAGQGTVGLEIGAQLAAIGAECDAVLVPCSGGGLSAGIAIAVAAGGPPIFTVEPEGFDDTARSLAAGRRLANDGAETGYCDALLVRRPGELTFDILRRVNASGLTVRDDEVCAAMAAAFEYLRIVLEPSGAVALAAARSADLAPDRQNLVIVASGGNVDTGTFADALASARDTPA